ncbi:MAG: crossover junction endodeoxyribonuclease RuvC [Planctomycetota bacterium]|nr:crossover junction endodeoxyribonuclease RuvC [Planctomycetota bacterium]
MDKKTTQRGPANPSSGKLGRLFPTQVAPIASDTPPALQRILGIDPGLNITGYAVLEFDSAAPRVVEAGVVRGKTKESLSARLLEIHDGLCDILATLKPTALALEQLYSHYDHPRTSILMGHARGVICLCAAKNGIPVLSYSATQIKKVLTGNGRAPKSQIQTAVQRELRLPKLPEPADVADALAIALCHYYLERNQSLFAQYATPHSRGGGAKSNARTKASKLAPPQ